VKEGEVTEFVPPCPISEKTISYYWNTLGEYRAKDNARKIAHYV